MVGVEAPLLHVLAEPANLAFLGGPLDVALCGPRLQAVVPFALWVVAHVRTLREHERAQLALGDQLGGLGEVSATGNLRTHLHLALGALHGIIELERFAEVTRHWFLNINVFAGLHRLDANARVPVIHRGAHHRVDVLALDHFAVICIGLNLVFRFSGDESFGIIGAVCGHITNCSLRNVITFSILSHLTHMRTKTSATDTDIAYNNLFICALHIGRGCLVASVYGDLQCGSSGCHRAGFFEEFSAGFAGLGGLFFVAHKLPLVLLPNWSLRG